MLVVNGKPISLNGKFFEYKKEEPSLPPYTIRLEYTEGVIPHFDKGIGTQVSQLPNIWDLTYNDTDWSFLLNYQLDLKNVLDANTTNVTNMDSMFGGCTALSSIPVFNTTNVTSMDNFVGYSHITAFPQLDTSNVVNMNSMFQNCLHIDVIPNLNTNKVKTVDYMFAWCPYITGGILDFYNQLTSQSEPPSSHVSTFYYCGVHTETGSAELAQIPDDWKLLL